ncbi:MAG: BamA/TamA family outer membrane protein [Gemmatimonadetes bacterium]|nr:BamA/TamA family outer membrane protein [Gemmatimonadota bacterium]
MVLIPQRLAYIGAACLALCLTPAGVVGQTPDPEVEAATKPSQTTARPRIGLVLSGGGARGAAHIGVLKVLEDLRVPVDYVAGTSMGAIIGGLYASGMSPEAIERELTSIDWNDAFQDAPPREELEWRRKYDDGSFLVAFELGFKNWRFILPRGLISGQKLGLILSRLTLPVTHISDFDDLPIPFRAMATDVGNGEAVVLEEGRLSEAMRASMSVPGVFSPYELDGRILADGGLVSNLPVDVAREMGAEILIVSEISTPYSDPEELASILEISEQLVTMVTRVNTDLTLETLGPRDILIQPDLGDLMPVDFPDAWEAVDLGEAEARASAAALRRHSLPSGDFARHRSGQRQPEWHPPTIRTISLENGSPVSARILLERMDLRPGMALDETTLERDISRLFGLAEFEEVSYQLENRDELNLRMREKSWGPNYIRFGLTMSDDSKANSRHTLRVSHTRTYLNRLGGEWKNQIWLGSERRLTTEFYQPLDYKGRFFLLAGTGVMESTTRLNLTGSVSTYRVTAATTALAAGIRLGTVGQFQVGVRYADSDARVTSGESEAEKLDAADGGLFGELVLDTYRNINFPRSGGRLDARYRRVVEGLAADQSYHRLDVGLTRALTTGDNTFLPRISLGTSFGTELATFDKFALGGFANISGYERGEIIGARYGLISLMFYRALRGLPESPLGSAVYLGGSLSTGHAWDHGEGALETLQWGDLRSGGSIFVGFDTLLGPIYLAQGFGDGGRRVSYFFLGRAF